MKCYWKEQIVKIPAEIIFGSIFEYFETTENVLCLYVTQIKFVQIFCIMEFSNSKYALKFLRKWKQNFQVENLVVSWDDIRLFFSQKWRFIVAIAGFSPFSKSFGFAKWLVN